MKDAALNSENIHDYCEDHSDEDSPLLEEIERYAYNHTMAPGMVSGRLQGRFLSMISKLLQPKVIVEVGAFVGYATICLAEGLTDDGEIHTYEVNDELEDFLYETFKKSGMGEKIHLHIGDALEILPDLDKTIDLAFIDAGKRDYSRYYETILSKMKPGGVILLDNVLWKGKVLREKADKTTQSIKDLNKMIAEDDRVDKMLLPLRDGVFMVRKREEYGA